MSAASSIEDTLEQLDRLHQSNLQRQADLRDRLKAVVDASSFDMPDEPQGAPVARQDGRTGRSAGPVPDRPSVIPLPRRTTHGGPWGPKMRAKLEAEIIAKGGPW
jgi:hypothetical protein